MEGKHLVFIILLQQFTRLLIHFQLGVATMETDHRRSQVTDTSQSAVCSSVLPKKIVYCNGRNLLSVPKNLLSDTTSLDLSRNKLNSLYEYSFVHYTLLEELILSHNNITFIDTATFATVEHLTYLNLSGNLNLRYIYTDIFKSLANLLVLNLQNCSIGTFPHDTLRWLPRLRELYLQDNPITSMNITACPKEEMDLFDLSNTLLKRITNLTFVFPCMCNELRILLKDICIIEQNVIKSLHVKELFIQIQGIRYGLSHLIQLYKDLFKGIAQSSIEVLSVTRFDLRAYSAMEDLEKKFLSRLEFIQIEHVYFLTHLNSSLFGNLANVQKLDIYDSAFQGSINPQHFAGMYDLQDLDLSGNEISAIDGPFYPWIISVRHLNLSFNLLDVIPKSTFSKLYNLVSLDLSENRFLNSFSIILPNLKYLNVSFTMILRGDIFFVPQLKLFSFAGNLAFPYMTANYFYGLNNFKYASSIQILDLSNSRLERMSIYYAFSGKSLFRGLTNLTELDLHGNNLRMLQNGTFDGLSCLKKLYLGRNSIDAISNKVFDGLKSLLILGLQDNEILSLYPTIFIGTPHLESLHIQGNILTQLDSELFVSTPNLTHLHLNRNKLTTLNIRTFKPIMYNSIRSIDVSENPFKCSCDLKWLVKWLRNSEHIVQTAAGTCSPALEGTLCGKPLTSIDPSVMCSSRFYIYLTIPSIAMLLLIIVALTFHYRWLLRYNFFLLKLSFLGYREAEDLRAHRHFHYDLNIMFTGDDEVWATQLLKRNLEEQLPQFERMAFGDEDLPLNMYYLDAVLYLIEHSFKSILLLSRAAIQDNDFMVKLRVALNHVTNVKMQNTVLVFLEKIPEEDMPYLVKSYLGEQMYYIDWVQSPEAQIYFWKQLIKRLKVDVRRTDGEQPE